MQERAVTDRAYSYDNPNSAEIRCAAFDSIDITMTAQQAYGHPSSVHREQIAGLIAPQSDVKQTCSNRKNRNGAAERNNNIPDG